MSNKANLMAIIVLMGTLVLPILDVMLYRRKLNKAKIERNKRG